MWETDKKKKLYRIWFEAAGRKLYSFVVQLTCRFALGTDAKYKEKVKSKTA